MIVDDLAGAAANFANGCGGMTGTPVYMTKQPRDMTHTGSGRTASRRKKPFYPVRVHVGHIVHNELGVFVFAAVSDGGLLEYRLIYLSIR